MNSIDKLREWGQQHKGWNLFDLQINEIADAIEAEISERCMPKSDVEMDKNAVQEYNLDVQVVAGQKIEYNTELRHRCGATTSMSVAFHLE